MKKYTYTIAGMSARGTENVSIPAIMNEVDIAFSCYYNPKHICKSFLCGYQ